MSIYGEITNSARPVYGETTLLSPVSFQASCSEALESLYRTTTIIEIDVHTLFPPSFVLSEITGSMGARAILPPVLFVRVTWRQRYPTQFFDTENILHRLQIKGIYIEFGLDHRVDPLFKDTLGLTLV